MYSKKKPLFPQPLRSLLKPIARSIADVLLKLNRTKLPSYFNITERYSFLYKGIESSVVTIASEILKPGDTVIDIGANIGYLTRQFALRVGNGGKVYSFEPDPTNFECLSFNTRRLPQVSLSKQAISDKNETTTFYLHPTSGMSNSLVNAWENATTINVETITFDTWIAEKCITAIRLIKIDVEGAEVKVLRGMKEALKQMVSTKLIIEFCPNNFSGKAEEQEIFDILQSNDLQIDIITSEAKLIKITKPADTYIHLNHHGFVNLLCRSNKL